MVGLTVAVLVLGAWLWAGLATWIGPHLDYDRTGYMAAVERWLSTGSPYLPEDVETSSTWSRWTFLHPPVALAVMLPFSVLPPLLWYVVPIAAVSWAVLHWRPAVWAWPLLAACLVWPRSGAMLVVGNTDLWLTAFVCLGLRFSWPAVLIAIKPSFAPLALLGIRDRRWWAGAAILAIVSLSFGSLWIEWLQVLLNTATAVTYSLLALPLVAGVPLIAWVSRTAPSP